MLFAFVSKRRDKFGKYEIDRIGLSGYETVGHTLSTDEMRRTEGRKMAGRKDGKWRDGRKISVFFWNVT
jgi:hypothetical protein